MGQIERKLKIAIVASDLLISYVREIPTYTRDNSWLPQAGEPSDDTSWPPVESSWVHRLNQAGKRYFRCTDEERKRFRQLIALGHKSCRQFCQTSLPLISGEAALEEVLLHILNYQSNPLSKLSEYLTNNIPYLFMKIEYRMESFRSRDYKIRSVEIGSMSDYGVISNMISDSRSREGGFDYSIFQCDMAKTPKLVKGFRPLLQVHRQILEAIFGAFEFRQGASGGHLPRPDDSSQVISIMLSQPGFTNEGLSSRIFRARRKSMDISIVEFLLQENLVKKEFLMHVLGRDLSHFQDGKVLQYFLDMCTVSSLYEKYDIPLVDLSHLATCFTDLYSVQDWAYSFQERSSLPTSLILMCGYITWNQKGPWIKDIHSQLIAISSEDSFFVASQFLQDPSSSITNPPTIIRLPGNIGRHGVVLLVAPKSLRHPNHENTLLEDAPFDGGLINCFRDTTLHLTLTGYELPLELVGRSGARHHGTWIFEAATSVHAAGKWIGDINPLELPYNVSLHRPTTLNFVSDVSAENIALKTVKCPVCRRVDETYESIVQIKEVIHEDLTSIDCWGEFFHRPSNPTVFRAKNNWAARLAVLCLSEKITAPVIPLHPKTCKCRVEWLLSHPNPHSYDLRSVEEWISQVEEVVHANLPPSMRPGPAGKYPVGHYHPIYLL
ncbi:hypothetical protein TWF173_007857 [Orbilia oligospora]|nr:hypothetical protein TWF173_007857 [Orbilia oligospora]